MENKIPKSLAKAIGNPFLKIVVVIILIGAVLLVGVVAGALLKFNQSKDVSYKVVDQTDSDKVEDKVVGGEEVDNGRAKHRSNQGVLQIEWADPKNQKQLEMSDRFITAVAMSESEGYEGWGELTGETWYERETIEETVERLKKEGVHKKVYVLGGVIDGIYKGLDLVLISWVDEIGMASTNSEIYALIDSDNRYVILDKYGTENFRFSSTKQRAEETLGDTMVNYLGNEIIFEFRLEISELTIQPIVTDENGRVYQYIDESREFDKELVSKEVIKLQNDTNVLERGQVDFYMSTVDGRVLEYDLVIPFWAKPSGDATDQTVYRPSIQWDNGSDSASGYRKARSGGCGWGDVTYVDNEVKEKDLVKTGIAKGHDGKEYHIFEPKWNLDELSENGDQAQYLQNYMGFLSAQPGYDYSTIDPEPKKHFDKFVASHPILFWKDSYNRWIRFENVDAIIAAECGKPVIYLYPEQTTDMTVKVDPKGGFTFTEPEYNGGWEVTAYPDGTVLNHGDNKVYPYLFWEGRGGLYEAPDKFWVVEQSRVESFLIETLSQVGLNETEITDFNEFWLPRMQSSPYYKIGFHGTKVMDALAPLDISVEPDSIFRILMDFEELQEPIQENPPKNLRPFKRNGFTVVEWGGVIR